MDFCFYSCSVVNCHCRLEQLTTESTANSSQKVEAIQQLMSQNETLTSTFKVSTEYCWGAHMNW